MIISSQRPKPRRRLKAGGSQDWLPHEAAEPQPNDEEKTSTRRRGATEKG